MSPGHAPFEQPGSRTTRSRSERDFGLDALRALAILSVLLLHASRIGPPGVPSRLAPVLECGWAGVDLFFVLSGFLIGGQLFAAFASRAQRLLWPFWVRRWTRTVPLYLVALFVYAVVKPVVFKHAFFGGFRWTYFFFLQNVFELTDFGQSWSLCVEEQFYFVFPLFFIGLASVRPRALAWTWIWLTPMAISVMARASHLHYLSTHGIRGWDAYLYVERYVRCNTATHLDGLAVGLFLAANREVWTRWTRRRRIGVSLAGGAVVIGALALEPMTPTDSAILWLYPALAVGFGAALIGCYGARAPRLGEALIRRMALWSYGAYVWNNLLAREFQLRWRGSWTIGMLAFVLGTFAVAWITYVCVEVPGMRLRRQVLPVSAEARA
jgi:peptidoglycan/LPS O-acetylase OafA/YrhL